MGTFDNINRIYECLMDEETKYIFEKRLMYSLSNDIEYINKLVNEKFFYHMISQFRREAFLNDSNLIKVCDILNNKKIVIYGAGGYGLLYVALFKAGITNGTVIGFFDKYKKKDFLSFSKGGQASRIEETGNETIEVNAIDNCISDIVTYIKMDIEGAEMHALLGAKNLIQKFHPKLAISIYHKKNDIIDIPLTILEIDSRYKFYLRHYSPGTYDTVLYAVIE